MTAQLIYADFKSKTWTKPEREVHLTELANIIFNEAIAPVSLLDMPNYGAGIDGMDPKETA